MQSETGADYTAKTLSDHYAIEIAEATRLIARFGCNRKEMDLLLGARDRSVQPQVPGQAAVISA
ncbi:hypothetical protein N7E02_05630 (plasmid) [Aliirhizobium terrae]|uniref:hypothetical protein n=1 Tax=Terrirhizobium terrae TaxID=2926709 RepID=UPI002578203A|nr:hypothetical protein [Rhizobium sp. CC-CFT758]WJH38818.1 hypothetical protein N7E02_05630 [Rhizobium sp. CC-CFT758]